MVEGVSKPGGRVLRTIRRLPIVGPLADCRAEFHATAVKRFAADFVFSTLPLWVGALVILLNSSEGVSFLDALLRTFERGELFIYCTATLAPIIYIATKEMRDSPTFPVRLSLLVVVIVIVVVCTAAFSLYRADVVLNERLALQISLYAYGMSLLLYYLTLLYDALRSTGAPAVLSPDYSWDMLIRASNAAFSGGRSPVSLEPLSIRLNRLKNRTIEPVTNGLPGRGTVTRRQVDSPVRNSHRFGPFHGPDSSSVHYPGAQDTRASLFHNRFQSVAP